MRPPVAKNALGVRDDGKGAAAAGFGGKGQGEFQKNQGCKSRFEVNRNVGGLVQHADDFDVVWPFKIENGIRKLVQRPETKDIFTIAD